MINPEDAQLDYGLLTHVGETVCHSLSSSLPNELIFVTPRLIFGRTRFVLQIFNELAPHHIASYYYDLEFHLPYVDTLSINQYSDLLPAG